MVESTPFINPTQPSSTLPKHKTLFLSFLFFQMSGDFGGFVTCRSADQDWYVEAETDFLRWQHDETCSESTTTAPPSSDSSSDADDHPCTLVDPLSELAPLRVVSKATRRGARSYLIEWSAADGLRTWETEADLEEVGHAPLLRDFHEERRLRKEDEAFMRKKREWRLSTNKAREEAEKRLDDARAKMRSRATFDRSTMLPLRTFNPARYWADFRHRIARDFRAANMTAELIYNICDDGRAQKFTQMLGASDSVPVLLYHGTRSNNIRKIINQGLRVPNSGDNPIRVANGSSHGVCIYTATSPGTSRYYSDGLMFVCAGMVGERFKTTGIAGRELTNWGGVCVFDDADAVLPCFLVRYSPNARSATPEVSETLTEKMLTEVAKPLPAEWRPPAPPVKHRISEWWAFKEEQDQYPGVFWDEWDVMTQCVHISKNSLKSVISKRQRRVEVKDAHKTKAYIECATAPLPMNRKVARTAKSEKTKEKRARTRQVRF